MKASSLVLLALPAFIPAVTHAGSSSLLTSARFCVTDIGDPTNISVEETHPNVFSINNRNEIVGAVSWEGDPERFIANEAFIWSRHRGMRTLGVLPDTEFSTATAINDFGVVVGDSLSHQIYLQQAFVWDSRRGIRPIHIDSDDVAYDAYGINFWGQVAGSATIEGTQHAILRQANGKTIDLGPGGSAAINDLGQVIGGSEAGVFIWDRWRGRRTIDLGPGVSSAYALDINNFGVVVGEVYREGVTRAFRWSKRTGTDDLGSLAGDHPLYEFTSARAINDRGYIVGVSQIETGENRAFLWHQRTGMRDLMDMLDPSSALTETTILIVAKGINDRGFIAVEGFDTRNPSLTRAYLLSPRRADDGPCE